MFLFTLFKKKKKQLVFMFTLLFTMRRTLLKENKKRKNTCIGWRALTVVRCRKGTEMAWWMDALRRRSDTYRWWWLSDTGKWLRKVEMKGRSNIYIGETARKMKKRFNLSNQPLKSCHVSPQQLWLSTNLSIKTRLLKTRWDCHSMCPSRILGDEPIGWGGNW